MAVAICQRCGEETAQAVSQCPRCGNTELIRVNPANDTMVGRRVKGRYEILKRVGQGGMGAVYLAEQVGLGHKVALKFLNRELSQDPELVRRFLNEAKSYARVSHPNAVALHDFGQDEEGNLFIGMEFVEGNDLRRLLTEKRRLPLHDALEIVLQVADVLAFAHEKGVIHRDLKPENIIVRQGMRGLHVKVLDFGIARLIEEGQARLTAQGTIAGTPRYMSPEQVEGKEIDSRVDVYALGLLFYEMLTGTHPFEGTTIPEILRKQVMQPMPRLTAAGIDAPELEAVILRATAKNREERFRSMTELAQAASGAVPTQVAQKAIPLSEMDPGSVANTFVRPLATPTQPLPPPIAEDVTQPPGPLDFHKTAFPGAPAPASGSRRAPLLFAAVGVMIAGAAAAVIANRPTEAPAAPSSALPVLPQVAKDPEPAPGRVVVPPPAVPAPQPGTQDIPEDVRTRLRLLAEEIRIKAEAEFIQGNFANAKNILAKLPPEQQQEPSIVKLRASIIDAGEQLARGKQQAARGECEAAVKTFDALLREYPNLIEAKRSRSLCQGMIPPSVAE